MASSCQRDDICPEATPTTPRMVIVFMDIENPADFKNVPALSIRATSIEALVDLNEAGDTIATIDSITVPLNPSITTLDFEFTRNTDDEDDENIDLLSFTYTPETEYINRACSFKSNYLDLQFSFDFTNPDNWIQNIEVSEPNITDELTTHVTIFH